MLWLISVLMVGCSGRSTNIDSAPLDTSSDEPVLDEGISLGEIQACEAPLDTVSYTEVGEDMGLSGSSDPDGDHVDGGSAVVHDLDGDGDLDIVLAYGDGPPSVYWRKGSNFDREQLWFPPQSFAMSLLDANQDGLMDIAVGSSHPVLLLNEGSEFETLYLPTEGAHTVRELAPGELNGDGIPDLFAVTTSPTGEPGEMTDFVMLGVGDGTFEPVDSPLDGALAGRAGFDAQWWDWDHDGDLDVYVVNDMGWTYGSNILWENRDGALVNASETCTCDIVHSGMSQDVADFDFDGFPDLYLAASSDNVLLGALGDDSYANLTAVYDAEGLAEVEGIDNMMAWSAIWLDRDNDGTLEILVAPGDLWAVDEAWDEDGDPWDLAPILLQDHDGAFRDVAAEVGLTTEGSWRTLVAADHNADGVLDLLLTDVVQRPLLYLSEGCTDAAWLEIEATVGSRIEVTAGERTWTGWTTRDSAMGGGRPSVVHLGLGDVGLVDELRVETPQGEVLRATLFEPRRRIAVD